MSQQNFDLNTLNGANGFNVSGINPNDLLGFSAGTAGDINGDGISDLVIGAGGANSNAGASYVIFGIQGKFPPSFDLKNLNGTNGFSILGLGNSTLGRSVGTAGDINDDGIDDLVLGAPLENSDAGASYVIYGSRNQFPSFFNVKSLNGTNGFIVHGIRTGDQFGYSTGTAGDINGDGIADLILGAPHAISIGFSFAGASYVIFGNRNGFATPFNLTDLNGTNGFTVPGVTLGTYLGYSVGTAGDINGDGISDLILGASAPSSSGVSHVIFGDQGGFSASFDLTKLNGTNGFTIANLSPVDNDELGKSVSAAGDINGDGISDLVLGAPGKNSSKGATYVIYGSRNGFAASFNLANLNGSNGFSILAEAYGKFGSSVHAAGDMNGDGISDIVISYPNKNSIIGACYVIYGSRDGFPASFNLTSLNGTNGFAIPGLTTQFVLGDSVGMAGDINNDTFSDIVLGTLSPNKYAGACYIIFGAPPSPPSPSTTSKSSGSRLSVPWFSPVHLVTSATSLTRYFLRSTVVPKLTAMLPQENSLNHLDFQPGTQESEAHTKSEKTTAVRSPSSPDFNSQLMLGAVGFHLLKQGIDYLRTWWSGKSDDKTPVIQEPLYAREQVESELFKLGIELMQIKNKFVRQSKSVQQDFSWVKSGIEDYREELKELASKPKVTVTEIRELEADIKDFRREFYDDLKQMKNDAFCASGTSANYTEVFARSKSTSEVTDFAKLAAGNSAAQPLLTPPTTTQPRLG